MPHFVVEKVQNALNDRSKALRGSRIHVSGVAYKRDIDDVRESPALDIIHLLAQRGAQISYSDPYVPTIRFEGLDLQSEDLQRAAKSVDCVVIVTDHKAVDYKALVRDAPLIVDTRNALKGIDSANIVRL
jgi:UDP-N-acetyl-D-glucosamine dehydrogenase